MAMELARHILDKVTLFLGRSVDRRAIGSLGLGSATRSSPGAGKDGAENSHGELLRREDRVSSCWIHVLPYWMQKGMDEVGRNRGFGGRSSTYDVGADLLAGNLVVDDHLEGMGLGQLEI